MNVRPLIPTAVTAGAAALGLLALSACSTADASDGREDGKLKVVASFYPMQFLAERIGGDHVKVSTLTKPGVEPHDLELKPRQAAQLEKAGYILYLKGVQPAVDTAIEKTDIDHKTDAAKLADTGLHTEDDGHDHGAEGDGHGHDQGAEGDGHGAEGDGHDHGEGDPHLWLDPLKYAQVADGVGAALAKADPDHAADYRKNAAALVTELKALHTSFEQGLKNTTTRTFVTTHSAFGHLAERYGLKQEGIAGIDPEAEPSPARIKELQTIAQRDRVTTVFFETLASDRTAKTLAGDTGLRTDVLDPLEGITEKSKGRDYFGVMNANLTALKTALGAK
ncbi:metal ABC transporter substrate-binding protein [Streptomyces qinzhouensis]|uniref:Zinc ABC transporter substrate-binding protein n=1 Tax=Streptomyces qinzhouensis TaxID=2599401 RepID=A0A5B8IH42_9ACTN|nr:metal ABC transporter substrate-binding protein [Streptomyces qinzhouensis]QDY76649.1 zinc ABC transporter substrate-binding protein [Streptomyces qinzhouensis]